MKKFMRLFSVLTVFTAALLILPMKAEASTLKEYTITYRPGNIAEFTDGLLQKYEELYGEENVSISQVTGSISIEVPAGSIYPEAPQAADVILDKEHQGRYYVTTGWIPTAETVMQDEDYVVDYAALVDAIEYTVRYVDIGTGLDLVSPVITQGNKNDQVTFTAKAITDYQWDAYVKQMTLEDGKDNVITFYYTYTKAPEYETIVVPGETILNVITLPGINIPAQGGTGTGTGTENQGTVDDNTQDDEGQDTEADDTETDDTEAEDTTGQETEDSTDETEEESTQGGSEGNQSGTGEEITIEEEEVPLANFMESNGSRIALLGGGLIGLAAVLAGIVVLMKKNAKAK